MAISVCIVDDTQDIRSALEEIIQMSEECNLIGSFSTASEALEKIPLLKPNVVLMDINLGGLESGIECVRQLKPEIPSTLFMMCTVYEEDEKIFEALSAGANAYILKKTPPAKLLDSIKELYEGGAPMSSEIARKVVANFRNRVVEPVAEGASTNATEDIPKDKNLKYLSRREKEILQLLSRGLVYKEIAAELFITAETVRKHVYHIYDKLHVNNRIEAVNKYFGR